MVAARVASQPAPPDWPGYLLEVVPFAHRGGRLPARRGHRDRPSGRRRAARSTGLAVAAAIVGYGAWIVAMAGTVAGGMTDPGVLWAAQTVAMVATVGVGLLVRAGDERLGSLVMLAAGAMLLPWAGAWLVFGTSWTAVGWSSSWRAPCGSTSAAACRDLTRRSGSGR